MQTDGFIISVPDTKHNAPPYQTGIQLITQHTFAMHSAHLHDLRGISGSGGTRQ